MTKTNFLHNYKVLYIYHPDEPIAKGLIRKNAGEKTFQKIFKLLKRSK